MEHHSDTCNARDQFWYHFLVSPVLWPVHRLPGCLSPYRFLLLLFRFFPELFLPQHCACPALVCSSAKDWTGDFGVSDLDVCWISVTVLSPQLIRCCTSVLTPGQDQQSTQPAGLHCPAWYQPWAQPSLTEGALCCVIFHSLALFSEKARPMKSSQWSPSNKNYTSAQN